jgi:isopentenyl-diphosphate delta-isomerase
MEQVILVNEMDVELGLMEKMEAHTKALLHRAFSIFVFNSNGEMLLQQRAITKYHSGGLWTNTCCSHPRPGETVLQAANRRLKEEMGFETNLIKVLDFVYKAPFSNGLTEHEFDHVLVGYYDGIINPNQEEVEKYSFNSFSDIEISINESPDIYTEWFKIAFPLIKNWWQENNKNNV